MWKLLICPSRKIIACWEQLMAQSSESLEDGKHLLIYLTIYLRPGSACGPESKISVPWEQTAMSSGNKCTEMRVLWETVHISIPVGFTGPTFCLLGFFNQCWLHTHTWYLLAGLLFFSSHGTNICQKPVRGGQTYSGSWFEVRHPSSLEGSTEGVWDSGRVRRQRRWRTRLSWCLSSFPISLYSAWDPSVCNGAIHAPRSPPPPETPSSAHPDTWNQAPHLFF